MANFLDKQVTWLRSLLVALVTLWNARRGEEGSRLMISEFQDALKGRWLQADQIEEVEDQAEKYLIGNINWPTCMAKGGKIAKRKYLFFRIFCYWQHFYNKIHV